MQFIIFLDDVGAQYVLGRINRREVIFPEFKKVVRLKPIEIRPVEVIQPGDKAGRAAGGFLLLGLTGAALGVLTSKGPKVLFELVMADGSIRRGVVEQSRYGALRRKVEKLQTYRPGDLGRSILGWSAGMIATVICSAALGPLGLVVGPAIVIAVNAFLANRRERLASQTTLVAALLMTLAGCAATPYDFPVPVMVGDAQAVSMTGYVATDDEAAVHRRLEERMKCPQGLEIVSLETARADNRIGTHILQYRAIIEPPLERGPDQYLRLSMGARRRGARTVDIAGRLPSRIGRPRPTRERLAAHRGRGPSSRLMAKRAPRPMDHSRNWDTLST